MWLDGTLRAVLSNKERAPLLTVLVLPFTDKRRAALPAINGVAIEVPDSTPKEPKLVGKVDRMFPPGVTMDGLKKKSLDGP